MGDCRRGEGGCQERCRGEKATEQGSKGIDKMRDEFQIVPKARRV